MSTIPLFSGFLPSKYTEDVFRQDVESFGFLAIRQLTERIYLDAAVETRRIFPERPEIQRMVGQIRHSMMEQELRSLGRRGDIVSMTVSDEQLRCRRGCIKPGSYVAIRYGDLLVTQSHTDNRWDLPPEALFRRNNARINQWTLDEEVDGAGPQRYIVYTHGPDKDNPEELSFMQAGLIHPSGREYIYTYDLSELPVAKIMGLPQTNIDIEIDIYIIDDEKEEGGEE